MITSLVFAFHHVSRGQQFHFDEDRVASRGKERRLDLDEEPVACLGLELDLDEEPVACLGLELDLDEDRVASSRKGLVDRRATCNIGKDPEVSCCGCSGSFI